MRASSRTSGFSGPSSELRGSNDTTLGATWPDVGPRRNLEINQSQDSQAGTGNHDSLILTNIVTHVQEEGDQRTSVRGFSV